ncbi:peroxidase 57-like [Canna indica]|uniref:Peroxidase 57-like n=1 Tax=Canna indica TaxID=4628 RepID=A0AAQ3KQM0_9LILI|nr:peroxidase 57-like [Canna indica]
MATLFLIILLSAAHALSFALSLEIHYYRNSCPRAELIVKQIVKKHFQQDQSVPAGLLRGAAYALPTGRRDGNVSKIEEVHLPSPYFSIQAAEAAFKSINLDVVDLTTLLGAHGVGFCHCGLLNDRLYNYQGTGLSDPRIPPALLASLKQKCPPEVVLPSNLTVDAKIFLNQATSSPFVLDSSFYQGLINQKALLQLDQDLAYTDLSLKWAKRFVRKPKRFIHQFSKSMIKLGNVGVLTGKDGEIRQNCRKVNKDTSTSSKTLP